MNKKILTLAAFALLLVFSACRNNDDDDDNTNPLDGAFHAVIDGANWDAPPANVGAVVTNFGTSGPSISINGSRPSDTTHFMLSFPYFTGTDTIINGGTSGVVLRFQGAHVWDSDDGTLNVARTIQDGYETYTGSFGGNFEEFFDSTNVRVITGGTFTAKRLL